MGALLHCCFLSLAPVVTSSYLKPTVYYTLISPTEFRVKLINPFDNIHGDVVAFSVLVVSNLVTFDPSSNFTRSWQSTKAHDPWLPYLAVHHCAGLFEGQSLCNARRRKRAVVEPETTVDFTVGTDEECDEEFCNGHLEAETSYHVALVGYVETGDSTVGPFSSAIRTRILCLQLA
jgi:hypothetical protein